jgi:hypothetical protein
MGFEPTIPAFEREKTVHALDRAGTVFDTAYVGVDAWIHTSLTSTLVGGEWSVHAPAALPLGKESTVPIG